MTWLFVVSISVFFLAPLGGLISHIPSTALIEALGSSSFFNSLRITLISSGVGSLLAILFALFFSRVFALYQWKFKRVQRLLFLIPYLVPNFILATAYVVAWNPITGLLNSFFPLPLPLYGLFGMCWLFAITHSPIAFLLLEDKIKRLDPVLKEAARISGASVLSTFFRIELPLLKPTLISAFSLCFGLNISAFAIPAWIGAPERKYTLTYKIYQAIQLSGPEGIPQAAAFSFFLFLLMIFPLLLNGWAYRDERKYAILSGKASQREEGVLSFKSFFFFQTCFVMSQLVFWIAPLICLSFSTLVKPGCFQNLGFSCLSKLSLGSYYYVLFELSETKAALHGSLVYGTFSSGVILGLCLLTLILCAQTKPQLKILDWVFSIPVATPGAIIAIGLIITFSGRYGINLYNTPWIVVIALILKHFNLAFQPLRTGLGGISASLTEAARISGASTPQLWGRILLPILKPEWMGGVFLVLIPILGELTMSVFLTSPHYRSIGTVLFDLQDYADQASAAALSILLVFLILFINELARVLSRGRLGY